ncbi:prepilin-type N-terminal cleavage/methylation domain-containing protein [Mammaliicoccus fleurettii]|nr:prepilin-type N-terminal cleavage/methylation domain-containing protein [Mammaliicoccus fleurettii]
MKSFKLFCKKEGFTLVEMIIV